MSENKRNKVTTDFYNRISGNSVESIVDVPPDALKFISLIDYNEIAKPFIKERMMKGEIRSLSAWARFYSVSERIPRTLKELYELCAK